MVTTTYKNQWPQKLCTEAAPGRRCGKTEKVKVKPFRRVKKAKEPTAALKEIAGKTRRGTVAKLAAAPQAAAPVATDVYSAAAQTA